VSRDTTAAVGRSGGPAAWRRAVEGARVALQRRGWGDARWSFLFGDDTGYATGDRPAAPAAGEKAAGERGAREGAARDGAGAAAPPVQGPVIKPPVWTWEIPLYFWFGGMAAGSSFVALACDLAGDHRSARTARKVAVAALGPSPALLVMDLGRPERFLNMLRIFKPRSPMSMGAWALTAFGNLGAAAVGADLLDRPRAARALGAVNALVGGYLGSYTGVLLAATAVPVWARSRLFLGPIFVATGGATGAAACRLALVATGLPEDHPTRTALERVERGAIAAELVLSQVNEARLGPHNEALEEGAAGRLFAAAKWLVRSGLALGLARRRVGPGAHHAASACYLAAGLCFRYAWVAAGRSSATDDEAVVVAARGSRAP
jgi:formate-dependent nitrite reductase membrane component NrfD